MTGAFAADLLLRHFHTTAVADNTLVADALVLSAMALVILRGTEDALTEKTVALRLVSTVVDGFRLQYFSVRICLDFFRRCQTDRNLRKVTLYLIFSFKCHIV